MEPETLEQTQHRLAAAYPAWHFWRSRRSDTGELGDLNATRIAHITGDLVDKGLARTLPMGVGKNIDLEAQLKSQVEREREIGYVVEGVLL